MARVSLFCLLFAAENQAAIAPFTLYREDFSSRLSLPALGFSQVQNWETDVAGYMKTTGPGDWGALSYAATPPFGADRTKNGDLGLSVSLYLDSDPSGPSWREDNSFWLSFGQGTGLEYTLFFKPNRPQDAYTSYQVRLIRSEGSNPVVLAETNTHWITPARTWLFLQLKVDAPRSAGGDGMIKGVFNNGGGGGQEILSALDETFSTFDRAHIKFKTGSGALNYPARVSNILVTATRLQGSAPIAGSLPRPVLFVHGINSDAGTWGISDAYVSCTNPGVQVQQVYGTTACRSAIIGGTYNSCQTEASAVAVDYSIRCPDRTLTESQVIPVSGYTSQYAVKAPTAVTYDASTQIIHYAYNGKTGSAKAKPDSVLRANQDRHLGDMPDARPRNLVSAYSSGSAPDVLAKKYGLSTRFTYPDVLSGINHNGLYFYNALGKDLQTLDGLAPLPSTPDGTGQTDQLYRRLVAVLDDYYGQDIWWNNPNAQVDIICHSQGGLLIRNVVDQFRDPSPRNPVNHIHQILTVDTPHAGTAIATNNPLQNGQPGYPNIQWLRRSVLGEFGEQPLADGQGLWKITASSALGPYDIHINSPINFTYDYFISPTLQNILRNPPCVNQLDCRNPWAYDIADAVENNHLDLSFTIDPKLKEKIQVFAQSADDLAQPQESQFVNRLSNSFPNRPMDGKNIPLTAMFVSSVGELGLEATDGLTQEAAKYFAGTCAALEVIHPLACAGLISASAILSATTNTKNYGPNHKSIGNYLQDLDKEWSTTSDIAVERESQNGSKTPPFQVQNTPYRAVQITETKSYKHCLLCSTRHKQVPSTHIAHLVIDANAIDLHRDGVTLQGEQIVNALLNPPSASSGTNTGTFVQGALLGALIGTLRLPLPNFNGLAIRSATVQTRNAPASDTLLAAWTPIHGDFDLELPLPAPDSSRPNPMEGLALRTNSLSLPFQGLMAGEQDAGDLRLNRFPADGSAPYSQAWTGTAGATKLRLRRLQGNLWGFALDTAGAWDSLALDFPLPDTLWLGHYREDADTLAVVGGGMFGNFLPVDSTVDLKVRVGDLATSSARSQVHIVLDNSGQVPLRGFAYAYYFRADSIHHPQVRLVQGPGQRLRVEPMGGDLYRAWIDAPQGAVPAHGSFPDAVGTVLSLEYADGTPWSAFRDPSLSGNLQLLGSTDSLPVYDADGVLLTGIEPRPDTGSTSLAGPAQPVPGSRETSPGDSCASQPLLYVANTGSSPLRDFHMGYFFTGSAGKTPDLTLNQGSDCKVRLIHVEGQTYMVDCDFQGKTLWPRDFLALQITLRYREGGSWNKRDDFSWRDTSVHVFYNDHMVVYDSVGTILAGSVPPMATGPRDYSEDFSTPTSLMPGLGFEGADPIHWERDSAGFMRNSGPGDWDSISLVRTPPLALDRNHGHGLTITCKVKYASDPAGPSWREQNKLWLGVQGVDGGYTLLVKPNRTQDLYTSPDLEWDRTGPGDTTALATATTHRLTPTNTWLGVRIHLNPTVSAGGDGHITISTDDGSGLQPRLDLLDNGASVFDRLVFRNKTGTGAQHYTLFLDDIHASHDP